MMRKFYVWTGQWSRNRKKWEDLFSRMDVKGLRGIAKASKNIYTKNFTVAYSDTANKHG